MCKERKRNDCKISFFILKMWTYFRFIIHNADMNTFAAVSSRNELFSKLYEVLQYSPTGLTSHLWMYWISKCKTWLIKCSYRIRYVFVQPALSICKYLLMPWNIIFFFARAYSESQWLAFCSLSSATHVHADVSQNLNDFYWSSIVT